MTMIEMKGARKNRLFTPLARVALWVCSCVFLCLGRVEASSVLGNAISITTNNATEPSINNAVAHQNSSQNNNLYNNDETNIFFIITNDVEDFNIDDDLVQCPLCPEPFHQPQDPNARFDAGQDASITCEYAHSLGVLEIPKTNCSVLQNWGSTLCRCALPASESYETSRCRLCEDGSSLPNGRLAGLPHKTCAELQVQASRDDPAQCPVYQATVGTYCRCNNPKATSTMNNNNNMCRICGQGQPLPDHLKSIDRHPKTCGELEFDVNMVAGEDCHLYQKLYSDQCCDTSKGVIVVHDGSIASRPTLLTSIMGSLLVVALVIAP